MDGHPVLGSVDRAFIKAFLILITPSPPGHVIDITPLMVTSGSEYCHGRLDEAFSHLPLNPSFFKVSSSIAASSKAW